MPSLLSFILRYFHRIRSKKLFENNNVFFLLIVIAFLLAAIIGKEITVNITYENTVSVPANEAAL